MTATYKHFLKRAPQALVDWFAQAARDLPWRRTRDPYAIWVSEIMLQQTQVSTVIPYWERWMQRLPNVQTLAAAEEQEVLKLWEGLGYYRRARHLHLAAKKVVAENGGNLPLAHADWLEIPGIGRYTAGAICSIAFQHPVPILDGNVVRILCRLLLIRGDTKDKAVLKQLWDAAQDLVNHAPDGQHGRFNESMMELGATICTPRQPLCLLCPVAGLCAAKKAGVVDQVPQIAARATITPRYFAALLLRDGDRTFLRQRASNEVNGGFWELPNVEAPSPAEAAQLLAETAATTLPPSPLKVIQHRITRYSMTLAVYQPATPTPRTIARIEKTWPDGQWFTSEALKSLPVVKAHRRAVT